MKLHFEEQLLSEEYRKKVLDDIKSGQAQKRKAESKRRLAVYKDKTIEYVLKKLQAEGLKDSTIKLMENRAANVSICRRVINKLARSYNGGVKRDAGGETPNAAVSEIVELMDWDAKHKKLDKYRKLLKNARSHIVPEPCVENGVEKYRLKIKALAPHQFDVLEDARDAEKAGAIVLSDYKDGSLNSDQTFIWWSKQFHFTTDDKGQVIGKLSPLDLKNPIGMIPGADYAEDQDGCYWADGGDDLVDGSILVNLLLTDRNAIAYMQGWGQFVVTGKKIPTILEGGPHSALVLQYDEGDPKPEVTVVNANPPLADWADAIEQTVALILSTNNLSPSNASTKLDPANYPSGIAMLIEKSEATEPVEEAQKQFRLGERTEFEVVKRWLDAYSAQLDVDFAAVGGLPQDVRVQVKFNDTKEVTTESERLTNIKTRKELGINREVELIMLDNPDMSEADAQAKLDLIKGEGVAAPAVEGEVEQAPKVSDDAAPSKDVQSYGLNGAQVTALVDIVAKVSAGELPRSSGVALILAAFPFVDSASAERIMGDAGGSFKPTLPMDNVTAASTFPKGNKE